jgi:hypothetical protein
MFVTRMLWGLCLCALASATASAAGDSFVAEGLVDPAHLGAKAAGKSPQEIEDLLLTQASFDAALHLGLYSRGVLVVQQAGPDGRYAFVTGAAEFQPLAGVSPETRKLRKLKSGLDLAEVTYGPDSIAHLNLPKDFNSLPLYRVKGEYQNANDAMSKISLHWKAVGEAYHAALVEHLAKLYPGKEIESVRGRVYPVRVIEAELLPVSSPAPARAGAVASGAAAPARGSSAASASAGTSAAAASSAATFDSKQFSYRVEMEVRIRLDEVKFAAEKSATRAASASSAGSAASATGVTPAAAPSSASSATSGAAPTAAQ